VFTVYNEEIINDILFNTDIKPDMLEDTDKLNNMQNI
jgi:hypothetical protein